jgi:ubiquinone/menaquinone biosynthesis C-methylase UbiE
MVHEVAAEGFGDPSDYEAARPSYPAAAIEWFAAELGIGPGRRVCDLAAGTGKFTRLLTGTGAELCAVEPVAGMREAFRTVLPTIPLVAGTAEALPFSAGSFDVVLAAQAWHWFEHDRAAAEVLRVVQPGGGVGLVWNARDRSAAWVDAIWGIMDRVEKRAPWRDHEHWRDSARPLPGFEPMKTAEFRQVQELTHEQVGQRIASVSHVAVLPDRERRAVLDEVRSVLDHDPATRDRELVPLPYRVDCIAYRHA